MFIYNVTVKVENNIAVAWLDWLRHEHIPDIINTGCFIKATIMHLLETDDSEGITYAIQYHAENKINYDNYIRQHAGEMRKKAFEKWGEKFIAFRSVMEVVN